MSSRGSGRGGEQQPPFFLDRAEQPYTTVADRPFDLTRVWGVGGKTNVWGRLSLRYSNLNLSEPARDGWEMPWPVSYGDLAPYYDRVEKLIGACGGREGAKTCRGYPGASITSRRRLRRFHAGPTSAIEHVMEARGLRQRELAALIGSQPRASEVLNRRRSLTLAMIRALSGEWNLPADVLVRDYDLTKAPAD